MTHLKTQSMGRVAWSLLTHRFRRDMPNDEKDVPFGSLVSYLYEGRCHGAGLHVPTTSRSHQFAMISLKAEKD